MADRPLTIAQIDEHIALLRSNLRELLEQAAAYSGAADDDLISSRIARQEAELEQLMRLRDMLHGGPRGPGVGNVR